MKIDKADCDFYWSTLPVGRENAIDYTALCCLWECSKRQARNIMNALQRHDNGDNYVLIRSSKNRGFYLSADKAEIYSYMRECRSKALSILSAIKKCNRILGINSGQMLFDLELENDVPERNKSEETAT